MPPAPSRCLHLALSVALTVLPLGAGAQSLPQAPVLSVRTTDDSRLNLRASASGSAPVLMQLGPGTEVENLGCEMVGNRGWCRIATRAAPRIEGWAAAEFLAAAPAPAPEIQPTPAETACLEAVARRTNTADVAVLALDDSQPEVLVQVGVGPDRNPWQCLAAPDGSTHGIEDLGTGGDASPQAPTALATAEAACRAAVAQAAGNGMVLVLSSAPLAVGTRVRLVAGTDPAPWTCMAHPDGAVEIGRQGGQAPG